MLNARTRTTRTVPSWVTDLSEPVPDAIAAPAFLARDYALTLAASIVATLPASVASAELRAALVALDYLPR
jgi:hypothetical protein